MRVNPHLCGYVGNTAEVLQVGDVGFHGGHHGGWGPLILPSPLSLRLQHLQLGPAVSLLDATT